MFDKRSGVCKRYTLGGVGCYRVRELMKRFLKVVYWMKSKSMEGAVTDKSETTLHVNGNCLHVLVMLVFPISKILNSYFIDIELNSQPSSISN